MIAHVAEASEGSGRVLLWLDPSLLAAPQALEASVRLAYAYGSELETIEVDPPHLDAVAQLPLGRVGFRAPLNIAHAGDEIAARQTLSDGHRARVDKIASQFGVPVRHARSTGEAIDRLAHLCTVRGPWNIIVLSRTPSLDLASVVANVFANVSGATGVLVGSRRIEAWGSRVAVVVEDGERLPSMLRTAERLTGTAGKTHLVIASVTKTAYRDLDAQARLLTAGSESIKFEATGPTLGVDGALDEQLSGCQPSLVIARFGGTLLSDGRALSRCLAVTGAPFLLVR